MQQVTARLKLQLKHQFEQQLEQQRLQLHQQFQQQLELRLLQQQQLQLQLEELKQHQPTLQKSQPSQSRSALHSNWRLAAAIEKAEKEHAIEETPSQQQLQSLNTFVMQVTIVFHHLNYNTIFSSGKTICITQLMEPLITSQAQQAQQLIAQQAQQAIQFERLLQVGGTMAYMPSRQVKEEREDTMAV